VVVQPVAAEDKVEKKHITGSGAWAAANSSSPIRSEIQIDKHTYIHKGNRQKATSSSTGLTATAPRRSCSGRSSMAAVASLQAVVSEPRCQALSEAEVSNGGSRG